MNAGKTSPAIPQQTPPARWCGTRKTVAIPAGRDPFVNTPLLALGPGEDGQERFWISTWNANVGCLAALVTESGEARIHRFGVPRHSGFYSAVQEDRDTLWLCGNLARVVRLSLRDFTYAVFSTGAPEALVFQGMVFDRATGKLFALANVLPEGVVTAFSFDTRRLEMAAIHTQCARDKYMRGHFPNGDGTFSLVLHVPGESLLRWDPRTETLDACSITESIDTHAFAGGSTYRLMANEQGLRYFPGRGWYDAAQRVFRRDRPLPLPAREMTWFARVGACAWGADFDKETLAVNRWDFRTGEVHPVCTIPDSHPFQVNVTASGKLVAVNKYGFFYRFDGASGVLERSRRLPADSVTRVDCLCRIDARRLLGTPFITQRFWEADIRTGQGHDCGRAAPGGGQIAKLWKIGGKVYMAAYAGGELVEYDPAESPRFPENPRVVAAPPHAMRPVAAADDGRHIYYCCTAPYGNLGSTLTRYDTVTGAADYAINPLPDQQIASLWHDPVTGCLVGGTTPHADCRSCEPSTDRCWFVRIDPATLQVVAKVPAPEGTLVAIVEGPLGGGRFLCTCNRRFDWSLSHGFALDAASLQVPEVTAMQPLPEGTERLRYAGKPGCFVLIRGKRVEVWDMRRGVPTVLLDDAFEGYGVHIQGNTVYLAYPQEIVILEQVFRKRPERRAARAAGSAR